MAIIYRRYPLSGTQNFRDLGGYATAEGGITRWNVFFRSACPDSLSAQDIQLIRALGITEIIDLRGGANADERQKGYVNVDGCTVHNLSLGGGVPPRTVSECPQSYMQIAEQDNIASVFRIFAHNKGATLFHCFAGKDRTGVVSAILLMLAGVADSDIMADYAQSYAYFLQRIRDDFARLDAEKDVFIPHPDHIEGFVHLLRKQYGSAYNLLTSKGLTPAELQAIKDKFVQTNS